MNFKLSYYKKIAGEFKRFEKIIHAEKTPLANEIIAHEGDGLYHSISVEPIIEVKDAIVKAEAEVKQVAPVFVPEIKQEVEAIVEKDAPKIAPVVDPLINKFNPKTIINNITRTPSDAKE